MDMPDEVTAKKDLTLGSSTELQAILDAAVDGIVCIDSRGIIDTFNGAAERLFGYRAAEVIGENVRVLMPDPDRKQHDEYLARYLQTGKRKIIGIGREVTARRKDGTVFPMSLSVGQIGDLPDPRFVAFLHDVTKRRRVEDELRLERDRTRIYLDVAGVILLALDTEGRITMINRQGCEILGYTQQELIGRDWFSEFIPERIQSNIGSVFDNIIDTSGTTHRSHENPVRTRSGEERLIAWQNSVLTGPDGETIGTLSSGEDITERHRAEEEARVFRERLTHVSRLSTMGEMAAGLAHEINQPLTAITTYAQACQRLLKAGAVDSEELLYVLTQVSSQAERAGEVIRKLRRMVKKRATQREKIDINGLIRDVVTLAEADARASGVSIKLELTEDLPPVMADSVQIQQVLLNLIRNGIDASQDTAADARVVTVRTTNRQWDQVRISVADRGHGVSDETASLLFQPFVTTKSDGLGLGLSISRTIVRVHDGRIGFENNPEGGATFFFSLPVVPGD